MADWVSSSQARRDRTTLLRFLSSSMILASRARHRVQVSTRRISTREAGKPRRPMSRIRPPLTTSMTVPSTISSFSFFFSIVPQARSYWACFGQDQAAVLVLLHDQGLDVVTEADDLVGVDVMLDGQLALRG